LPDASGVRVVEIEIRLKYCDAFHLLAERDPRSRGSHISSSDATVRSALPRPVMPLCLSVGVNSERRARNAAGKCTQKLVVCISCSGIFSFPDPTFSIV